MTQIQRHYNKKDVDMLITAATIVESAIANKDFLVANRPAWADPFLSKLRDRIDVATHDFLGVDSAKELRLATQTIVNIQTKAIKDLSLVKVQIQEDFKKDKSRLTEILNTLGFSTYHKDAQNKDQEALISLLYRFKTNLTDDLKSEIVSKGMNPVFLENVINHTVELKNADINQETFKGSRKSITAAARKEFNEIYDEVISLSRIASKFLKDQPLTKEQFSFAKVSKVLNSAPKKKEE